MRRPFKPTDVHSGLTAKDLREFLSYDPESGVFIWRVKHLKSHADQIGRVAGCLVQQSGYIVIGLTVNGLRRTYMAHRLAWLYVTGEWPTFEIDHINQNRADNRFSNLRDVRHYVNTENERRARPSNKCGLLGVSAIKASGRFFARIHVKGKVHYLGRFDSAEEAHKAYVQAKRRYHAGCTL